MFCIIVLFGRASDGDRALPSCVVRCESLFLYFFEQKTAYEMRSSDWSSDVCSSDLSIRGRSPAYRKLSIDEHGRIDDVEGLFHSAALRLMQEIDPYLVAVYHFRKEGAASDYPLTTTAIDFFIVHAYRTQLPWVYALSRHVLHNDSRYEQATGKFRPAPPTHPHAPRPL